MWVSSRNTKIFSSYYTHYAACGSSSGQHHGSVVRMPHIQTSGYHDVAGSIPTSATAKQNQKKRYPNPTQPNPIQPNPTQPNPTQLLYRSSTLSNHLHGGR